jgi:hypothetical protein
MSDFRGTAPASYQKSWTAHSTPGELGPDRARRVRQPTAVKVPEPVGLEATNSVEHAGLTMHYAVVPDPCQMCRTTSGGHGPSQCQPARLPRYRVARQQRCRDPPGSQGGFEETREPPR